MAITCALSMSGNVIAGQPAKGILTITNAAGSDVTVSSIQPVVSTSNGSGLTPPAGVPYTFSYPKFPPNRSSTVTASGGTLNVPVEFVFFVPQMAGSQGDLVTPGSTYLVNLTVQVSDGSQAACGGGQWVSVSSGAPSPSQGFGQFRFDDGRNLINSAVL